MIVLLIFMLLITLSGYGVALWVNESWYKHSIKTIDDWADFTQEIINEMGERNVHLAEEVDRLKQKEKNE